MLAKLLKPAAVLNCSITSLPYRCCVVAVVGTDEKNRYFFYEDINTSRVSSTRVCMRHHGWSVVTIYDLLCVFVCPTQITMWFAMGLLFCLDVLYGIILIMFCCRVGYAKRREGRETNRSSTPAGMIIIKWNIRAP